MNFDRFTDYVNQFVNLNSETLMRFWFNCFDLSGTGEVWEHDIFQIFEIWKENIPVQSFINVLETPGFFNDIVKIEYNIVEFSNKVR